ncbi:MAG TPA: hypothetical protein VLF21_00085 [Candidatus Saccharimonadales bacterium]|nr:hypothetical protein [Candidatus Saccharimonadales bacterium]
MYVLATQLKGLPVLSLQTGQPIASVDRPIMQGSDLEIMALHCRMGRLRNQEGVILMRDIRQVAADCIIIDSFDEIEDVNEIVRLKEIAEKNFDPIGKMVVSESGQKLGKVEDYTINLKTFLLQKLYVHQSVMKSILFNNLVVDRTQIIEISPRQFVVRDATVKQPSLAPVVPKSTS